MLVIVSDIHMTDRETGAPVADEELALFVRGLQTLEPRKEKLTLLLLGDIIDFLRSEEWDRLWLEHDGAAPWSSLGRDFKGFEDSLQEGRLLAIVAGVESRYPALAAALGDLKKARATEIRYVVGNHDFMLQVSRAARERVVGFLSLDEDPQVEFPVEYENPDLSVFAEHGHRYDASKLPSRAFGPLGHWRRDRVAGRQPLRGIGTTEAAPDGQDASGAGGARDR